MMPNYVDSLEEARDFFQENSGGSCCCRKPGHEKEVWSYPEAVDFYASEE